MTALDIFALIVLLVLIAAVVAIWVILGMMPGLISRHRVVKSGKSASDSLLTFANIMNVRL